MDFVAGEILLVDKPLGWTSFDVVNKMRYEIKRKLKVKKIKVGHAGTLDPLADGLLILCTGKKTKEIDNYMGMPKMYSGTITLGATTPSYDLETQIDATFPLTGLTEDMIYAEAKKMEGDVLQNPPIFSAKKLTEIKPTIWRAPVKMLCYKQSSFRSKNLKLFPLNCLWCILKSRVRKEPIFAA